MTDQERKMEELAKLEQEQQKNPENAIYRHEIEKFNSENSNDIEKSSEDQDENPTKDNNESNTEGNDVEIIPLEEENQDYDEKISYVTINGFRVLDTVALPYQGKLYPKSWRFSFRCPTTKEVAEFSTIDERDQPRIIQSISGLIQKCFVIVDIDNNKQVNADQINDGDRLFFFLKLREYYMEEFPIEFPTLSMNHQEPVQVRLMANNLIYNNLSDKLLSCYDGRTWTLPGENFNLQEDIVFLNPTLNLTDKILRYTINKYKELNDNSNNQKVNNDDFNKKFFLVLPYLYTKGNEKVESLKIIYKNIEKNENLMKAYLTIANKMQHTNEEYITFTYKDEEEKTLMKFPGGWKNMFQSSSAAKGLFD